MAWEKGAAAAAEVGDGGKEKKIGGCSGDNGWDGVGEGRVYGVTLVLQPVEGEEQGQVVEWGVGTCQKANATMIWYDLGFQEHFHNVPGPLRELAPSMQQLKG